jgi:hypothetical protein
MSGLINGASPSQWLSFFGARERSTQAAYLPDSASSQMPIYVDLDAIAPGSFAGQYWPRTMLSDNGDGATVQRGVRWGFFDQAAGSSSRYVFRGVTRDQYGSAVETCSVLLYRTSTTVLVDSSVSNANGNFELTTAFYPDFHYIVAHKSGSPDIDGVSPNTLVGA